VIARILAIIAAIAAFFGLYQKTARETEKRKSAESALKDARSANEIDNDVRNLSDSDLYNELRDRKRK